MKVETDDGSVNVMTEFAQECKDNHRDTEAPGVSSDPRTLFGLS